MPGTGFTQTPRKKWGFLMNSRTVGAVLCLVPAVLGAQTTLHLPQPPHQLSATGRALTDLLKQRLDAAVAANGVAYSRFIDSAFVAVEDTTVVSLKAFAVEITADTSKRSRSRSFDVDNIRVYEHGDLAILAYDVTETVHYGDQAVPFTSRSSSTYYSRAGHWYLVFLKETSFPIEHVALAPDTSRFDSYLGKYDWGGDYGDVISRDGSRLFLVQTGDTTHDEMFPEGGDRFFVKDDAGTLLFARDAAGKVTALIYHGPGRITVTARKAS